ncbi:zinc finger protein 510-like [Argiope bruennichi]|uniref:zinc finger protein 510-like n=1 Tax=Argiope bruennichi TaxID=94029 RepID=UPI002494A96D|nr:zinc finger protein 510-like [Argiope bruennichi]
MTHRENHPCFIHNKFESKYLPQLPVESDENFHEVKDKPTENSNDISRCLSRDARQNEKSVESSYRPENDHRETDEKILIVSGSGSVDIQKQHVSDLFHKTPDEESKAFLENSKWKALNNDKNNFTDSLEYVIRQDRSHDNKISGRTNLILQPDLPPGSTELDNGIILMSGNVMDEHISLETNSKAHSESDKMFISVEEPFSKKEDDNAVAGFSGFCSRKKKFPKTFRRQDTLKTNYQIHAGNKLFECDICEKDFSRKSHLDRHYRTHTGEKPYICNICGKECSQKSNLITHHRTHLGDKPFMCDICNKSFAHKGYLNTHFRTHTGVKPYKCPACEMSFINSSNRKKHYRNKHE